MTWWIESQYKTYWSTETLEGMTTKRLNQELKKAIKNNHLKDIESIKQELQKR